MRNLFLFIFLIPMSLNAQDSTEVQQDNRPVRNTFIASTLIYQQTVSSPVKGGFELFFVHRFGSINNGANKLFGLYSGGHVRMSIAYGINDNIMLGVGSTMPDLWDGHWKISILKQTRSGSMPISLSYFGNIMYDSREREMYDIYTSYNYKHRFSYYTQLMLARKFANLASIQISPSLAYFNAVERDKENINIALSASGKINISSTFAAIAEYTLPLTKPENFDVQPGAALGFEVGTPTHSFQIFLSNYRDISPQHNIVFNDVRISDLKNYCIGFNLTVRF